MLAGLPSVWSPAAASGMRLSHALSRPVSPAPASNSPAFPAASPSTYPFRPACSPLAVRSWRRRPNCTSRDRWSHPPRWSA